MESYRELLDFGKKYLNEKKIENSHLDAWLLMEYVCKISRSWYFIHEEEPVKDQKEDLVEEPGEMTENTTEEETKQEEEPVSEPEE